MFRRRGLLKSTNSKALVHENFRNFKPLNFKNLEIKKFAVNKQKEFLNVENWDSFRNVQKFLSLKFQKWKNLSIQNLKYFILLKFAI